MSMREIDRPSRAPLRWLAALALLAAPGPSTLASDELPAFRAGMWELKRSVEEPGATPMNVQTRNCFDPSAEMRRMWDFMNGGGCVNSPLTRSGNVYTITADCKTGDAILRSRTAITVESDSAYSVVVTTTSGERQSRETMSAQRVGDCSP